MKNILLIVFLISTTCQLTHAQGDLCAAAEPGNGTLAWIDPPMPDVEDSVYLYIDVSQDPNCDILVGNMLPLYIWTWSPAQPDDKLGTWNDSDEAARMEQVDGDIWRIGMIPTEFYGVEAEEIYDKGICFLAKRQDGGIGGDCRVGGSEPKTTDVHVPVPSPFAAERKVYSFPDLINADSLYTQLDDVFTLFYDNKIESKLTMQNLADVWIYFRVIGSNGQSYNVTPLSQIGNNPDLQMVNEGDGLFSFQIIPETFLADVLPDGVQPARLRFQFITLPLCGSDCAVDGDFYFVIGCQ